MWSSGRRVLQDLLHQPSVRALSLTQTQNTVIVERWWQVPLSKVGSPPRLHPRRHRIYKLVEDTTHHPKENMELILTQTVPKLGGRGDTVFVKKSVGRNKLLPQGLAVYPSPENRDMFAEEAKLIREGKIEGQQQTRTGQLTVEFLKRTRLDIVKMPSDEFQLTKAVVCRQFLRKFTLVVPPHALKLSHEPIKEVGDYWCEVTVNGMDTVRVPMSLLPYEDPSASHQRRLKEQRRQQEEAPAPQPAEEVEEAQAVGVQASEAHKDSGGEVSESSASTAAAADTTQDTTAPPSDGPRKE